MFIFSCLLSAENKWNCMLPNGNSVNEIGRHRAKCQWVIITTSDYGIGRVLWCFGLFWFVDTLNPMITVKSKNWTTYVTSAVFIMNIKSAYCPLSFEFKIESLKKLKSQQCQCLPFHSIQGLLLEFLKHQVSGLIVCFNIIST